MMSHVFAGKLGLQQRVLPAYRVPFFDHLAGACSQGMCLFAGSPRKSEGIIEAPGLGRAKFKQAQNLHLLGGSAYLCWQKGLLKWLEEWDPSAIIMEANPRYPSSSRAISWMKSRGRPVIGWGLGAPASSGSLHKLRSMFRQRFVDRFDAVIAYSTAGAEEYAALGIPRERLFVAHNAVSSAPSHMPVRVERGGNPPQILFVGRLQARKRLDLLIQACAILGMDIDLTVVGDGPSRTELSALASDTYPRTTFTGVLRGRELEDQFMNADLFVLPGTGGLAVQEAMSYGLPVIVAEGDGTQNDLVSGGNGWLVPVGDLDSLTAAMREALHDPARLEKMGMRSYEMVRDRFNIDSMTDVFLNALDFAGGS
jgi:glycosyltransferase involved in cell wall biosynthesis